MRLSGALMCFALSALFAAGDASATAQEPDVLIVDGQTESLYTNPLSAWLEAHPDTLPQNDLVSSGNWRGYVATWEVAGGKLWLRKVDVTFQDGMKPTEMTSARKGPDGKPVRETRTVDEPVFVSRNVIDKLFPGAHDVVALWYTGTLIIPKGKLVQYVHMGYGSTYEHYAVIWVRQGEVVRQLDLKADQFIELRKARFKAYQQTDAYKKRYAETVKELGEDTEQFLFNFAAEEYLSADPDATP